MGVFNKTIIPLALVGYDMIIAKPALFENHGPKLIPNVTSIMSETSL